MGLFKNEVGRPSNEILKKRKIIYLIIILVAVLGIGTCVFYTANYFKNEGNSKNISVSKIYQDISVKNNSGGLFQASTKGRDNLKKIGKGKYETVTNYNNSYDPYYNIQLSSSKASLTVKTTYPDSIKKGKTVGLKKYYYQVQVFSKTSKNVEISKSSKIDIKKSSVEQKITTGSSVGYIEIVFYDATKDHKILSTFRLNLGIVSNMEASFPDKNFRNCVLSHYNIAYKTSKTDLTDAELAKITGLERKDVYPQRLKCEYGNIKDATGIEKLKNLQSVSLIHNKIEKIDVSKNTKLVSLYLCGNKLKTVNLRNNVNLVTFYSNDSYYYDSIDLSKNTKLQVLHLIGSNLKTINLSKNTKLREVHLNNNNLTSLDLSKSSGLQDLRISGNNIKKANIKVANGIDLDKILKG